MTGVGFHPSARAELLEASAYYEEQALGLGAQFVTELGASSDSSQRPPASVLRSPPTMR